MKSNVENMESQMSLVMEDMKKINVSSDKINAALSSRRAKIDQLTTLHRLMKKVHSISISLNYTSYNFWSNYQAD
jgi:hypothetical protein